MVFGFSLFFNLTKKNTFILSGYAFFLVGGGSNNVDCVVPQTRRHDTTISNNPIYLPTYLPTYFERDFVRIVSKGGGVDVAI